MRQSRHNGHRSPLGPVKMTQAMRDEAGNLRVLKEVASKIRGFQLGSHVTEKPTVAREFFINGKIAQAEGTLISGRRILASQIASFLDGATRRFYQEYTEMRDSNRYELDILRKADRAIEELAQANVKDRGYDLSNLGSTFEARIEAYHKAKYSLSEVRIRQYERDRHREERAAQIEQIRGDKERAKLERRVLQPIRDRRTTASQELLEIF